MSAVPVIPAVSLDAAELAALPLSEPVRHEKATEGDPHTSFRDFHESGGVTVGVWECTPGRFPSAKEGIGELMQILSGRATLTAADGTTHELVAGTAIVTPDGWRGEWHVHETIRKVYAIWRS